MSQSTHATVSGVHRSHRSGLEVAGAVRAAGRGLLAAFEMAGVWLERRRQRRALESLPDHLLSDIGISRADAAFEADKPFWRA